MSVDAVFHEEALGKLLSQPALEAAGPNRLTPIDELRPPALNPNRRASTGRALPFVREDDDDFIPF
jgi:hypothetical protein